MALIIGSFVGVVVRAPAVGNDAARPLALRQLRRAPSRRATWCRSPASCGSAAAAGTAARPRACSTPRSSLPRSASRSGPGAPPRDGPVGELWLAWTLLALALIDLEHQILPDVLTLPLAAAGLAVAWLAQRGAVLDNIAGAALGYAVFFIIAWAYRRWRGRDGLGAGDAKLLAALGAWDGATGLPSVVLLGSLMALAVVLALRSFRLSAARSASGWPFGPALAAAGWLVWLYGPLVLGPS